MVIVANKQKIYLEDIFIFFVSIYLFLDVLSNGTEFSKDVLLEIYSVKAIWWNILRGFVIFKFIVQLQKCDYKIIVLLLFAYFSSFYTSSYWMSEIIWILAGMKHVDLKKIIKLIYYMELCAFVIVVVPGIVRIVENTFMTEQSGTIHQTIGFNHPNALAARVFQLEAIHVYCRDRRINKLDIVFLILISAFVYFLTGSQTVAILSIFMVIFAFLTNSIYRSERSTFQGIWGIICKKIIKRMKYISIAIPVVATVLMLFLSQFGGSGTLFSRAYQASNYFQYYGISLWGQPLQINNGTDNFYLQKSQLYTLDNSYLYLLIGFGVVFFILFVASQILLIYRSIKQKEYTVATILMLYMIYGIVETMMIRVTYNFSILFMSGLVWGNTIEREYKTHENIIYSSREPVERS